ncbi:MAG: hypothetical protein IIC90_11625 [Chloroflexi bacterium]|nr:hypothetical protein [Chloroflexota bacterium]
MGLADDPGQLGVLAAGHALQHAFTVYEIEKQALLEAADLTELANTVITLMEMAIRGSGSGTLRH